MIWAYYRVSTADQNYESQKIGVLEYCNRVGYRIDREVVDDGVSGAVKAKERNLWKIVKNAQSGDWIITSELSRIGRSTTDVLNTLNILAKKGVNVYFIKQGMQLDQSPMGKMMVAILSAFAEMERDLIRQRTIEGLERVRKQGKHIGRPYNSKNRLPKLKKEEVIFMTCKGLSKNKVAELLNCHPQTLNKYLELWGIEWKRTGTGQNI